MTIHQAHSQAEWLSQTFDWDLTQAAEFVREIAAEAFNEGYQHCSDTQCDNCYTCGSSLEFARNPYLSGGVNAGQVSLTPDGTDEVPDPAHLMNSPFPCQCNTDRSCTVDHVLGDHCVKCGCSEGFHDADGFCAGPCGGGGCR